MNLDTRVGDLDITLFTPYTEVKKILLARFNRRLESRTGGTDVLKEIASNGNHTCIDEGYATAHGKTPCKPRKGDLNVGGASTPSADSQSPIHTAKDRGDSTAGERRKRSA